MATVHHIINSYAASAGGAERMVRSLHLGLLAAGCDTELVSVTTEAEVLPQARSLGLARVYDPRALLRLRRYVVDRVKSDDIVHAHLFPANFYIALLKRLGVISCVTVATEHSTANRRRGSVAGYLVDRLLYPAFAKVFAISDGVAQALLSWMPALSGRVDTVPNGVILRFCQPQWRQAELNPVILSVGHFREAKNYPAMIRAVAELDQPCQYWIAGTGEQDEALRQLVQDLGLDERVRFLGYVDDIGPCLQQASIFLMASKWEGFGLAAVEAMNASLPVVAADVDGLREIVTGRPPSALLVDPDSPADIAAALERLLRDAELRHSLGQSGFERAAMYSVERMVASYLSAYRRLSSESAADV